MVPASCGAREGTTTYVFDKLPVALLRGRAQCLHQRLLLVADVRIHVHAQLVLYLPVQRVLRLQGHPLWHVLGARRDAVEPFREDIEDTEQLLPGCGVGGE